MSCPSSSQPLSRSARIPRTGAPGTGAPRGASQVGLSVLPFRMRVSTASSVAVAAIAPGRPGRGAARARPMGGRVDGQAEAEEIDESHARGVRLYRSHEEWHESVACLRIGPSEHWSRRGVDRDHHAACRRKPRARPCRLADVNRLGPGLLQADQAALALAQAAGHRHQGTPEPFLLRRSRDQDEAGLVALDQLGQHGGPCLV